MRPIVIINPDEPVLLIDHIEKRKGKIVGSYLSFINLNLIVEFGRTAYKEILYILCYFSFRKITVISKNLFFISRYTI